MTASCTIPIGEGGADHSGVVRTYRILLDDESLDWMLMCDGHKHIVPLEDRRCLDSMSPGIQALYEESVMEFIRSRRTIDNRRTREQAERQRLEEQRTITVPGSELSRVTQPGTGHVTLLLLEWQFSRYPPALETCHPRFWRRLILNDTVFRLVIAASAEEYRTVILPGATVERIEISPGEMKVSICSPRPVRME